jgi:hypothetical protein
MGHGLEDRGLIYGKGNRFLSSPQCPDQLWNPLSFVSNGYRGVLSPALKRPGLKADHLLPSSV